MSLNVGELNHAHVRGTVWLAAAKLGRSVLSQFVRCEHSHWNTRVHNWSSVQFMCCEQSFIVGDLIRVTILSESKKRTLFRIGLLISRQK